MLKKNTINLILLLLFAKTNLAQHFDYQKDFEVISDGCYIGKDFFGRIIEKGKVRNGKQQGLWKTYYSRTDTVLDGNYKLYSKGRYVDGKKVGRWVTFYENGKKELIANFSNFPGPLQTDTIHFENGFSLSPQHVRSGVWKYFNKDGKLIRKEWYSKGKLIRFRDYEK
ncbi:MAG TPA: hypothetical protein VFF35_08380 [Bacteroidia bacterium]|nr:hypothetical protein [Bacteroidia bacterium]